MESFSCFVNKHIMYTSLTEWRIFHFTLNTPFYESQSPRTYNGLLWVGSSAYGELGFASLTPSVLHKGLTIAVNVSALARALQWPLCCLNPELTRYKTAHGESSILHPRVELSNVPVLYFLIPYLSIVLFNFHSFVFTSTLHTATLPIPLSTSR